MSCIYKDTSGRHCAKESKEGQFCPGSGVFLSCYTPSDPLHDIDFSKIQIVKIDNYEAEVDKLKELLEKNPGRVGIIPIDTSPDVEVVERPPYCKHCFNARVYEPTDEERMNPFATELTDDNDSSSISIGKSSMGTRFMISSGHGEPVRIELDKFLELRQEWVTVGQYYPKYCPECGRRLNEYDEVQDF